MKTSEVFGMQPNFRPASYIDRLSLDETLQRLIERKQQHIAIRGASKCGKSWLRQKILQNPILIQCRLDKSASEIYVDALSQLGIKLELESVGQSSIKGTISAEAEGGISLLAKVTGKAEVELNGTHQTTRKPVGQDINDLRFVAKILHESGRTLVIEDFHYLSVEERTKFSFDLKALWDYQVFVVVIGVWSLDNMLLSLNPDLSGRIEELSVSWPVEELKKILDKGGQHLNVNFSESFKDKISEIAFGSAGILQTLILKSLDEMGFYQSETFKKTIDSTDSIDTAAMSYAEQLNPLYQEFAKRVSSGIKERKNSTGIYAHAISVILSSSDNDLTNGLQAQEIFRIANQKQPRVQLGNLKTVLQKFEELQIDKEGRGLILAYNPATEKITVVDRQLLLYRKYRTVNWPWEELIREADAQPKTFGEA